MKSAQINKYSKNPKDIQVVIKDVEIPKIKDDEVLVKVKAAGVNPVDILIATGQVRLIQDYKFPLALGNELVGVIDKIGKNVKRFKVGDTIMARMPINQIGAFSEFVAIDVSAIALIPSHLTPTEAAAVPLTGLTGYQVLYDVLKAKSDQSLFLPGGTGGLGALVIPMAKEMGLQVITSGSNNGRERMLAMGVDRFINYKEQYYGDVLSNLDFVIDTLGPNETENELKILKPKGKLVTLKGVPNHRFATENHFPFWKKMLFKMAGSKYDGMAAKQDKEYHFFFVKSNGEQLQKVAQLLEKGNIKPTIDESYPFDQVALALEKVSQGHAQGKIIITFD